MLPVWIILGTTMSLPWTWYLTVPAIVWVIGFFLVDRKRHPQTLRAPGEHLVNSVKFSLNQVEHQIWLLRNVHWWYLLPFTIPILAFFAQVSWSLRSASWLLALLFFAGLAAFVCTLYYFIYGLNQRAVSLQLEPRRKELLALLASLGDETADELSDDQRP